MARYHYTDEFHPDFGQPWVNWLEWYGGKVRLRGDMTPAEAAKIYESDPQGVEFLIKAIECGQFEAMQKQDPITWGWKLKSWDKVIAAWEDYSFLVVLGGNRASKSVLLSRLMAWCMMNIPEADLQAYHVNDTKSNQEQQRFIYEALPQIYTYAKGHPNGPNRKILSLSKAKGQNYSLQWTQKSGFTGDVCIVPPHTGYERGSQILFNTYQQFLNDPQVAEGAMRHVVWCDEECPEALMNTLHSRLGDYRGKVFLTFTTLKGWTPLVSKIMEKAKPDEFRYAPELGYKVPCEFTSPIYGGCKIICLWSEDTPFMDYGEYRKKWRDESVPVKKARFYGLPTKSFASVFTLFSDEPDGPNVVKHGNLPWIKNPQRFNFDEKFTKYLILDPAPNKSWFMVWVAIDGAGNWWVYREYPDSSYGEWALPYINKAGTPVGKPGPAAKGLGYGVREYAELIRELEADDGEIYERIIDPRMGAAPITKQDEQTDLIEMLEDENLIFLAAPGVMEDIGLEKITALLAYDPKQERGYGNEPKLKISDRCENTIYALREYTKKGGKDESSKDPIDCVRYGAVSDLMHVTETSMMATGGGGY